MWPSTIRFVRFDPVRKSDPAFEHRRQP